MEEDRSQVEEVVRQCRYHHQSALPIKVIKEVGNHQIEAEEVEVVVEVGHVVIANIDNDTEVMRMIIQII